MEKVLPRKDWAREGELVCLKNHRRIMSGRARAGAWRAWRRSAARVAARAGAWQSMRGVGVRSSSYLTATVVKTNNVTGCMITLNPVPRTVYFLRPSKMQSSSRQMN